MNLFEQLEASKNLSDSYTIKNLLQSFAALAKKQAEYIEFFEKGWTGNDLDAADFSGKESILRAEIKALMDGEK